MILQDLISRFSFVVDQKPLDKLGHTLEGMHHKLEFLAAVEIVKGVWELAERFAGMGESLETAAVSAGITATEFQKLSYAASQNAVGQEELSAALARMSRKLQAAKDGSEQAAGSFAKLGIDSDQLKGLHNSKEAFYAVADAIRNTSDQQKRLALVQEFFGRGSAKMLKLIQKGSGEFDRLGAEAVQMGAILGDKGVEDLANFEDAFSGLMLTIKITMAKIGASFAPMFTLIIKDIEKFWGANQKVIAQDIKGWAGKAAYAFGFIFGAIQIATNAFVDFIKQHPVAAKRIGEVIAVMGVFSLAVTALLTLFGGVGKSIDTISGLFKIGKPLAKGFWWVSKRGSKVVLKVLASLLDKLGLFLYGYFPALGRAVVQFGIKLAGLAANPTVLAVAGVVAGIAAIVLLLEAAWSMLHGKSFKETWLGEMIDAVADFSGGAIGFLKEKLGFGGRGKSGANLSEADPTLMGPLAPTDVRSAMPFGMPAIPGFAMGTGALQALAATGLTLEPEGARAGAPAPGAGAQQNIEINLHAPITVTGVADAKEAGKETRKALDQHAREIQRNLVAVSLR